MQNYEVNGALKMIIKKELSKRFNYPSSMEISQARLVRCVVISLLLEHTSPPLTCFPVNSA